MIEISDQDGSHIRHERFVFPGGEVHVRVDSARPAKELSIHALLRNSGDVMELLMLNDALQRAYPGVPIDLCIPYVPYGRQDRVANKGEALGVKVMCNLINAQGFRSVTIDDPHSDVTSALIDRVVVRSAEDGGRLRVLFSVITSSWKTPVFVAPDAGARKRVLGLAKNFGAEVVFAEKQRDTRTGQITGTAIVGDLPDAPLLVIDDICDGGRTFIELAKALKEKHLDVGRPGEPDLYLYVTHGIFSKGLTELESHYKQVAAQHNWLRL